MAFRCQRWTLANALPVLFVLWVIAMIYGTYAWCHLQPLLHSDWYSFVLQASISHMLTLMLLVCFGRAIWTDPGSVPDTPEWRDAPSRRWASAGSQDVVQENRAPLVREVKQTGGWRFCKWCDSYKPDRCHHCRVCKSCILRMDHHCPWIANCVGFRNHKWFFLLVVYALLSCVFIFLTMAQSLMQSICCEYRSSRDRFLMVFGLTLAFIMTILLKAFCCLHVWLMLKATTTIEFCEKRQRHSTSKVPPNYDQGPFENIRAVLGPNPFLWLLPIAGPAGDGLRFPVWEEQPQENGGAPPEDQKGVSAQGSVLSEGAQEVGAPEVTGEKAAAA